MISIIFSLKLSRRFSSNFFCSRRISFDSKTLNSFLKFSNSVFAFSRTLSALIFWVSRDFLSCEKFWNSSSVKIEFWNSDSSLKENFLSAESKSASYPESLFSVSLKSFFFWSKADLKRECSSFKFWKLFFTSSRFFLFSSIKIERFSRSVLTFLSPKSFLRSVSEFLNASSICKNSERFFSNSSLKLSRFFWIFEICSE